MRSTRCNYPARLGGLCLIFLGQTHSCAVAESSFYASHGATATRHTSDECRDVLRLSTPLDVYCETDPLTLGWKQYGGWYVSERISLEGGYTRLVYDNFTGPANGEADARERGNVLFAGIAGSVRLASDLRATAKIGLAAKSDVESFLSDSADFLRRTSPAYSMPEVFGLGAERRFNERTSGRVEWERYGFDEAVDVVFASIVIRLDGPNR